MHLCSVDLEMKYKGERELGYALRTVMVRNVENRTFLTEVKVHHGSQL